MSTASADKSISHQKQQLRQALLIQRPGDSRGLTEQLIELTRLLGARRIGCYVATQNEPDTLPFLRWGLANELKIHTPTLDSNSMRWQQFLGDLSPGQFGIPVSSGVETDMEKLDLVLIPALAATVKGERLGRGGGFFDRAIAAIREADRREIPALAAIIFDSELLDKLPSEAHDQLVDFVVTPSKIFQTKIEPGR